VDGVKWLASHRACLLADEMGLGKTAQLLMALPSNAPALVVCPAVAVGTWVRELATWRPDLRALPLSKKTFEIPAPPHVGIVSYDSLPFDCVPRPGMTLIPDEAHMLKSARARRTQHFRLLAMRALASMGRVWLATGTPLLNRPQELWSVLHAAGLAYKVFGTWDNFVELFGGVKVDFTPKRRPGGPEEKARSAYKWTLASPKVRVLLDSVMLRRKRADVLPDLPGKSYSTLTAELDGATARACQALAHMLREGESVEALHARLSEDVEFETISALLERLATAKIPSMLQHIESFEDAGEPLVVFAAHRRPIEALKARRGWTTILGDDSAESRASKVAGFQAGKYAGIAGTIQAMGTSVTLTRANLALFVSRLWTPFLNLQAEDRLARIGQDRAVMIYDLASDHPLDARLVEVTREKTRLTESVL
jgi:SWI/SNF-related matrix-associated actin-dependent regulator 1 of chromatin subfamily A